MLQYSQLEISSLTFQMFLIIPEVVFLIPLNNKITYGVSQVLFFIYFQKRFYLKA